MYTNIIRPCFVYLLTFIKKPCNIINQFVRNDEKTVFITYGADIAAFGNEGVLLFFGRGLKKVSTYDKIGNSNALDIVRPMHL